jgi:hypothetical protein
LGFGPFHPFGFFFFFLADGFEGGDGAVGIGFLFLFVVFKVLTVPNVRLQWRVGDIAHVEDDVGGEGLEVSHAQVGARGLEGVKQETGSFVIHLPGDEQAHDLHERDLDGVGVFKDRQFEGRDATAGLVGTDADTLILKAFVEKTETVAAQRG